MYVYSRISALGACRIAGISMAAARVTGLLIEWGNGDRGALDRLMPLVYEELRRIARRHLYLEGRPIPCRAPRWCTKRIFASSRFQAVPGVPFPLTRGGSWPMVVLMEVAGCVKESTFLFCCLSR